ncbi:hypothetical protein O9K63_12310 [Janibacter cremeus]|uniref:hypothetical protein n=1 Tax=Janibacter cremeus TaxID=1285192 RepID=UPI0023FA077A|nr:hypothetical protein [Janibacter cremeus]WEV77370.1 hypothetical protein O9K63_12310 [Janibacter cremeus]
MPTVTYPSPVVPGPPRIHLEMPEGWIQVWAPDTLVALRDDAQGTDHFLANLVVRHYQRLAPFGADEITAELGEYAGQRQRGTLGALRSRELDGRDAVGAEVSFVDPQAGTVAQTHWFSTRQRRDVLDVVQVTGSFAGSRREADGAVVDRIIDSIRLDP